MDPTPAASPKPRAPAPPTASPAPVTASGAARMPMVTGSRTRLPRKPCWLPCGEPVRAMRSAMTLALLAARAARPLAPRCEAYPPGALLMALVCPASCWLRMAFWRACRSASCWGVSCPPACTGAAVPSPRKSSLFASLVAMSGSIPLVQTRRTFRRLHLESECVEHEALAGSGTRAGELDHERLAARSRQAPLQRLGVARGEAGERLAVEGREGLAFVETDARADDAGRPVLPEQGQRVVAAPAVRAEGADRARLDPHRDADRDVGVAGRRLLPDEAGSADGVRAAPGGGAEHGGRAVELVDVPLAHAQVEDAEHAVRAARVVAGEDECVVLAAVDAAGDDRVTRKGRAHGLRELHRRSAAARQEVQAVLALLVDEAAGELDQTAAVDAAAVARALARRRDLAGHAVIVGTVAGDFPDGLVREDDPALVAARDSGHAGQRLEERRVARPAHGVALGAEALRPLHAFLAPQDPALAARPDVVAGVGADVLERPRYGAAVALRVEDRVAIAAAVVERVRHDLWRRLPARPLEARQLALFCVVVFFVVVVVVVGGAAHGGVGLAGGRRRDFEPRRVVQGREHGLHRGARRREQALALRVVPLEHASVRIGGAADEAAGARLRRELVEDRRRDEVLLVHAGAVEAHDEAAGEVEVAAAPRPLDATLLLGLEPVEHRQRVARARRRIGVDRQLERRPDERASDDRHDLAAPLVDERGRRGEGLGNQPLGLAGARDAEPDEGVAALDAIGVDQTERALAARQIERARSRTGAVRAGERTERVARRVDGAVSPLGVRRVDAGGGRAPGAHRAR